MIKAGIIGATGYTGIELLRLLHQHPKVEIKHAFTESYVDQTIAEIYPHLANQVQLQGERFSLDKIADCDVLFISLPHGHAAELAKPLLAMGKKIIDLGADFRLKDAAAYSAWYQHPAAPEALLSQAVYGLPEQGQRESIRLAKLIANPGCYPTASILATLPALTAGIICPDSFIFDAKSGISGAGRSLSLQSHFCEAAENLTPYQLAGRHRHVPEIEQQLGLVADEAITIQFTPHIVPMIRGLLVTAYFKLNAVYSAADIEKIYQEFYQHETFIRICPQNKNLQVKQVRGSNYCDLSIHVDTRTNRLIVVSAIDNLIKGAAGQALQNMNLMYGLPEEMGLVGNAGIYP